MITEVTVKNGRKYSIGYHDPATDTIRSDRKAKVRKRIEGEVTPGDPYDIFDLIADLSKRLNMVERGLMFLLAHMKSEGTISPYIESQWGPMIDAYMEMLISGDYMARTDLAESNFQTFQTVMARDNKITQILKEEGWGK